MSCSRRGMRAEQVPVCKACFPPRLMALLHGQQLMVQATSTSSRGFRLSGVDSPLELPHLVSLLSPLSLVPREGAVVGFVDRRRQAVLRTGIRKIGLVCRAVRSSQV